MSLDDRAARLLDIGMLAVDQVREDPTWARAALGRLEPGELLDVATLLAACVDPERPVVELLAWHLDGRSPDAQRDESGEAPMAIRRDVDVLVRERFQLPERSAA